jgi:hypothetical protein
MGAMNTQTVSHTLHATAATLSITGFAKYAVLATLTIGVAALSMLTKSVPSYVGLVAIGTGLTGILAHLIHGFESAHRSGGVPRYTTVAAISGASALYWVIGSLAVEPFVQIGAGITWLVLTFGYVATLQAEDKNPNFAATRSAWVTAFLGLGLTAVGWIQHDIGMTLVALVVTGFAVFPQLFHLTQDAARSA